LTPAEKLTILTQKYPAVGDVINSFTIERFLASGVTFRVYVAKTIDGQCVVLKFFRKQYLFNPDALDQLEMEEEVLSAVTHPNLPKHLGRGVHNHIPYLVQEYISTDTLETSGRLSPGSYPVSLVATIMSDVCDALAALHEQNIIHRDVKPGNILVVERDGIQRGVLADFGSSFFGGRTKGRGERVARLAGAPLFMPPEIARRERATSRCDVFSAGATTCHLCCHADGPYQLAVKSDTDLTELTERAKRGEVHPPPLQTNPNGLEEIVTRATQANPDNRYSSAQALKEALYPFTLKK
jgi:serine/threonine-protein kinase